MTPQILSARCYIEYLKMTAGSPQNGSDINLDFAFKIATRLHDAVSVKVLIENGASVSVEENWAIQYCFKNNYIELVKILLENGASARRDDAYTCP